MDDLLYKSVHSIQQELDDLVHIKLYSPTYSSILEEYNDSLLGFKRLYYDSYRFLKRFGILNTTLDYILTLYPRHIYWNMTPKQLDFLISLIRGPEIEIIKYLLDLNLYKSDKLYNKYIELLGSAKLEYINLKNSEDNVPECPND